MCVFTACACSSIGLLRVMPALAGKRKKRMLNSARSKAVQFLPRTLLAPLLAEEALECVVYTYSRGSLRNRLPTATR